MKKIGILTYHKANNLGAVLQAYALQHKLLQISPKCDIEIIDYNNGLFIEKDKNNSLKSFFKNIYYKIKNKGFENFREKYLIVSNLYTVDTIYKSNEIYDAFITGSDQVWNLSCSGNDYSYFLNFVDKNKIKISYAASIGTYEFKNDEKIKIKEMLSSFDKISIRENNSLKYFDFIKKEISVVPDPVFLLNKNEWEEIIPKRIIKQDYILVYLIQDDINVMKNAEKYAKENNFKLISNKKSIEFILNNSPEKFLSWIKYAKCIFTNSFHGTAFSLIFEKNFYADIQLKNGKINNRVNDLLKGLSSEEHIIKNDILTEKFDYTKTNKKIDELRQIGLSYLKDFMKGIENE